MLKGYRNRCRAGKVGQVAPETYCFNAKKYSRALNLICKWTLDASEADMALAVGYNTHQSCGQKSRLKMNY